MYRWEGNVRELRNLGEYFCYLEKDIIEICDLPEYILDTIDSNYSRTVCNKVSDNIKVSIQHWQRQKHHEIRL